MSFKFTFREITPEDTEILRILKLRNAKPEEHICCEILRGDGITMKTWYSKADVALWGEDYIKANSKMKYIDGDWTVSLDVEPWKRTHGVSSKKVTSPSSPRYPTWLTGHVKEWAEKRLPTRQKVLSTSERITTLTAELNDGNSKIEEMKAEFNRIVSWSKIFDESPMEVKKMICGYIIKKVSVFRDYRIKIEFNINVEQFLNGIDSIDECDTYELPMAQ